AVDGGGLLDVGVLEAVVAEEEEQLVPALEQTGHRDRTGADRRPVVVMARGDFALAPQTLRLLGVAGAVGGIDAAVVRRVSGALRRVPVLVPILPGAAAAVVVRAALGHHADVRAARVAFGSVEAGRLDLDLRHGVGIRQVGDAAARTRVRNAIERVFRAADAARGVHG